MDQQCQLIVVMGVSGSGKSTIGMRMSELLGVEFIDADDLHSITNVDKMTAGIPLEDDDRWSWLENVGKSLESKAGVGAVFACSSLRRSFRDVIRAHAPSVRFVLLLGSYEMLAKRMSLREAHFMPPSLLVSQLEILEPLDQDEAGVVVGIDANSNAIAQEAINRLAWS